MHLHTHLYRNYVLLLSQFLWFLDVQLLCVHVKTTPKQQQKTQVLKHNIWLQYHPKNDTETIKTIPKQYKTIPKQYGQSNKTIAEAEELDH